MPGGITQTRRRAGGKAAISRLCKRLGVSTKPGFGLKGIILVATGIAASLIPPWGPVPAHVSALYLILCATATLFLPAIEALFWVVFVTMLANLYYLQGWDLPWFDAYVYLHAFGMLPVINLTALLAILFLGYAAGRRGYMFIPFPLTLVFLLGTLTVAGGGPIVVALAIAFVIFFVVPALVTAALRSGRPSRTAALPSVADGTPTESIEGFKTLAHWPALTAIFGLVLYVPTYLTYEHFYAGYGLSPDEVGITYATVLSREISWLIVSIAILLVMLVGALVLARAIMHPKLVTRLYTSREWYAPPPRWIRVHGVCALGLLAVSLLVFATGQTVAVPAPRTGAPYEPAPGSFFQGRSQLVEVTWISPSAPPSYLPDRLLLVGQSAATSILWDAKSRKAFRLPSSSLALTVVDVAPEVQILSPRHFGVETLGERSFSFKLIWPYGVAKPSDSNNVPCYRRARGRVLSEKGYSEVLDELLSRELPGGGLAFGTIEGLVDGRIIYMLPSYRNLSAVLIRKGAPVESSLFARIPGKNSLLEREMRAAAAFARRNQLSLELPCELSWVR